jgi:predicted metal-binding membrane protein
MGLAAFVPVWTLMMAAMMLPSVTPTASMYAKTFRDNRAVRTARLVVSYLAVCAAAGLPAYGLAWLAGWLTRMHPGAAQVLAAAVFSICGVYQLSGLRTGASRTAVSRSGCCCTTAPTGAGSVTCA